MNRRQFTKALGISAAAIGLGSVRSFSQAKQPQLAITMDDFSWASNTVRLTGAERNRAILAALATHSVKAALFVQALNIDNVQGKTLLKDWDVAGHLIGNHSYSHWNYHSANVTAAAFSQDILR